MELRRAHSLEEHMEQHTQRYRFGSRERLAKTLPTDWQGVGAGSQVGSGLEQICEEGKGR